MKKISNCKDVFLFVWYKPKEIDIYIVGGCPRGVMVKAMDCRIVVSEFVLQSRNYIHFQANTIGKGMNPLILPAPWLFFKENRFGIK